MWRGIHTRTIQAGLITWLTAVLLVSVSCEAGPDSPWHVLRKTVPTDANAAVASDIGFITPERGFGHTGNTVFTTFDGGCVWTVMPSVPLPSLQDMEIIDDRTVIFGSTCGFARLSDNRGAAWNALVLNRCSVFSFCDRRTAWGAAGEEIKAMSGQEAKLVTAPAGFRGPVALAAVSAERAFLMDNNGRLYLADTERGAGSWKTLPLRINREEFILERRHVRMRFRNEREGLLVAYNRKEDRWRAFLTGDGGRTWQRDALPGAKSGTCFISPDLTLVTVRSAAEKAVYLFRYRPVDGQTPDA